MNILVGLLIAMNMVLVLYHGIYSLYLISIVATNKLRIWLEKKLRSRTVPTAPVSNSDKNSDEDESFEFSADSSFYQSSNGPTTQEAILRL